MGAIIAQLFTLFVPIVRDIVEKWKAGHSGAEPTDAEIATQFEQHVAEYLAEGAAWRAAHPDV